MSERNKQWDRFIGCMVMHLPSERIGRLVQVHPDGIARLAVHGGHLMFPVAEIVFVEQRWCVVEVERPDA